MLYITILTHSDQLYVVIYKHKHKLYVFYIEKNEQNGNDDDEMKWNKKTLKNTTNTFI